jgi:hypothetical protein
MNFLFFSLCMRFAKELMNKTVCKMLHGSSTDIAGRFSPSAASVVKYVE